jgi:hypothetical protein
LVSIWFANKQVFWTLFFPPVRFSPNIAWIEAIHIFWAIQIGWIFHPVHVEPSKNVQNLEELLVTQTVSLVKAACIALKSQRETKVLVSFSTKQKVILHTGMTAWIFQYVQCQSTSALVPKTPKNPMKISCHCDVMGIPQRYGVSLSMLCLAYCQEQPIWQWSTGNLDIFRHSALSIIASKDYKWPASG